MSETCLAGKRLCPIKVGNPTEWVLCRSQPKEHGYGYQPHHADSEGTPCGKECAPTQTTDRKFRTIHLKPGERVVVRTPGGLFNPLVEIESQGKAAGRGNRHTVRVEAPPGSSIEILKNGERR